MHIREAFTKHTDRDAPIEYCAVRATERLSGGIIEYVTDTDYQGAVLDSIKSVNKSQSESFCVQIKKFVL